MKRAGCMRNIRTGSYQRRERNVSVGRHQLVLDFSRDEVVEVFTIRWRKS